MRTRRGRWLLIAGAVVTAMIAAAVTAWQLAFRDSAAPASIADALERFRARARAAETPVPAGVYVYATTGREAISALGGRRHRYPGRSTVTVTAGGCGMTLRWDVLEHRSNLYEICDEAARLGSWAEIHRFIGQDDRTDWSCSATAWLPSRTEPGAIAPYACRSSDASQRGTVAVVGEETVRVGGVGLAALHVRIRAVESGASRGPLREDRWLEPATGLPLRVAYRVETTNSSPIGDVVFEERYTLLLTSLEPLR